MIPISTRIQEFFNEMTEVCGLRVLLIFLYLLILNRHFPVFSTEQTLLAIMMSLHMRILKWHNCNVMPPSARKCDKIFIAHNLRTTDDYRTNRNRPLSGQEVDAAARHICSRKIYTMESDLWLRA